MTRAETKSRSARAAEQKRAAADRARAYRQRKREAREPLARAIDEAVAEAVAFHLATNGVNIGVDPKSMLKTARLILEREGYEPAAAAKAIAERMIVPREEHAWPERFPSFAPGPWERMLSTKGGEWTTPRSVIVKHLASI